MSWMRWGCLCAVGLGLAGAALAASPPAGGTGPGLGANGSALLAPTDCGPGTAAPCPPPGGGVVAKGQAQAGLLAPGARAKGFSLVPVDGGRPVELHVSGSMRPTVVAFWSMFCEPCRDELPLVAQITDRYADRGLTLISVNLDGEKLGRAVSRYMELNGMGFAVGLDSKAGGQFATAGAYGVTGTPSLFVVGGDGTVRWSHAGRFDPQVFEAEVKKVAGR
ncbi:MAG: TlpA family protein disulfide reductase [Deferrisomatales bacterium]